MEGDQNGKNLMADADAGEKEKEETLNEITTSVTATNSQKTSES